MIYENGRISPYVELIRRPDGIAEGTDVFMFLESSRWDDGSEDKCFCGKSQFGRKEI